MSLLPNRIFYGWWIVGAAFLNLFFAVGIVFYAFPVFYPSLVQSLGFTRAEITQGFLIGFVLVGLPFGFLAGALIDRVGARLVILCGIGFVGVSLILMGTMSHLWQYYTLCVTEVLGYVLAGPIPNQVLITNWFAKRRGQAMGYAYLGLGLGGAVSPVTINFLISHAGWRRAFEVTGAVILAVLFPVGGWITRSTPEEMGVAPDGSSAGSSANSNAIEAPEAPSGEARYLESPSVEVRDAVRTANFWLLVIGCSLVIGAIGTVIQHLVLALEDHGYSPARAAAISSGLLVSSLAGRVIVGYLADRFRKKNVMSLFYAVLGFAIPLLFVARRPGAAWGFALVFGFAMGADYMLVPLVTAECFGRASLGKLLALIIMGYSLGQWFDPWLAGRIFDAYRSYNWAWGIMAVSGVLGAIVIWAVSPRRRAYP